MHYIPKTLVSLTVWEENIIEGKKSDVFGVRGLAPAAVSSLLSICFYERVMHALPLTPAAARRFALANRMSQVTN